MLTRDDNSTAQDSTEKTAAPYEVHDGDADRDADTVLQLWEDGGFEERVDPRTHLRWFYNDNPEGAGHLNFLRAGSEGTRVGFLGVGGRRFLVRGVSTLGGMLVDFVVLPAHRTAMPALLLQRAGRRRASTTMPLLYGLPDIKAVMLFKRIGADVRFDLPTFARVVRSKDYLRRYLPVPVASCAGFVIDGLDRLITRARLSVTGLHSSWTRRFDQRFDALWQAYNKSNCCIGVRDSRFLQWRFGSAPGERYETFAVQHSSSPELLMYFVCEEGGNSLIVKDFLNIGSSEELTQGLLMLTSAARRRGRSVVRIQVASTDATFDALRRAGFRRRSHRPFFAMTQPGLSDQIKDVDWYITQADEDV